MNSGIFFNNNMMNYTYDKVYNLSDLNWEDETLTTGIGDIDGSDPSMKGYNKGWQMEPYKQRYYANKTRGEKMSRLKKTSAKEVIDISYGAENYANEILSLWQEADGPLQNFFEAFTMNKIDNSLKKEIARILGEKGFKVYPALVDERHISASSIRDFQISDDSLTAMENMLNGHADPIGSGFSGGLNRDFGFDSTTQLNSDISVAPNFYECRAERLKKKQ